MKNLLEKIISWLRLEIKLCAANQWAEKEDIKKFKKLSDSLIKAYE